MPPRGVWFEEDPTLDGLVVVELCSAALLDDVWRFIGGNQAPIG